VRLYRLLLHLYPASFRAEYGAEMTACCSRRLRDADGTIARLALWMIMVGDVVRNAAAVHAEILRHDLRYSLRTLRRSPAFTCTAVALIALGIGANTAVFSVTDFVLLRPLPFDHPDRLVKLWQRSGGSYSRFELSPENYRDWKRFSHSFESMGAFWTIASNLLVPGAEPERLNGAAITADLMPTLGVRPILGRTFTQAEDTENAAGTVILSDALWRSLFGSDPAVLGRRITLDDAPYVVIGVMPPHFAFPSASTEFWTPLQLSRADTDRTNTYLQVLARLKPGVSIGRARAEMTAIAGRLAAQFPKENGETSAAVMTMRDEVSPQSRLLLFALSGAAACVLLIVCANLANLLAARALERRREIAVRMAIGAGRDRLVRELATDSAVLALVGGALGVWIAYLSVPALARLAPANLPTPGAATVDVWVLLCAVALTAFTALAFGLLPALRIARDVDTVGLREGARSGARRDRFRAALVTAEVAASIVLLVAAGLLLRALWTIEHVDPGFRTDGVLTMRTTLAWPKYGPTEKRADFYARVLAGVRALPGVTDAAYISGLPMVVRGAIWTVEVHGHLDSRRASNSVTLRYVTPGFFHTLGIPLKRGRDVSDTDGPKSAFVAVVSESFARRHWPGEDPIGRRFAVAFFDRTIVGVVPDVRTRGLEGTSEPQVYIPYRQIPDFYMSPYAPKDLAIRTSTAPEPLVSSARDVIRRVDPREPISDVRLLADIVALETAARAGQLRVLAAFAAVAVLLAIVGIHGLLAFAVSQRTQEFGVRLALGARPNDVAGMVLREGVRLAAAGAMPGLVIAYVAGRSLQALLAGIPPADPVTYLLVAALTVGMTIAGSITPAWRAFRVNATAALRD
jgi:putative ABC transport system permease protein